MKGRIFVIGASLGGIDALYELVSKLPRTFPTPIFVAQHVASHSPGMRPHLLSKAGPLPAVHAKTASLFEPGVIYVAPPDRHILSYGPHENLARPAIDPLFRSAAAAYGAAVVGQTCRVAGRAGQSGLGLAA